MRYISDEIGSRIQMVRKSMGLTQYHLAEKLCISRTYLAKIEIGVKTPSIELLIGISEFTGVSLDFLVLGKNRMQDVQQDLGEVIDLLMHIKQKIEM